MSNLVDYESNKPEPCGSRAVYESDEIPAEVFTQQTPQEKDSVPDSNQEIDLGSLFAPDNTNESDDCGDCCCNPVVVLDSPGMILANAVSENMETIAWMVAFVIVVLIYALT